jgi:hypothetical protein
MRPMDARDSAKPKKIVKFLLISMLLLLASGPLRWFQPLVMKTKPTISLNNRNVTSAKRTESSNMVTTYAKPPI